MRKTYLWDEWFGADPGADRRVRFTLVAGEHYDCSQSSMCQQVRTAAKDRRFHASVADMGDRITVVAVPASTIGQERLDREREQQITYGDDFDCDHLRSMERNA